MSATIRVFGERFTLSDDGDWTTEATDRISLDLLEQLQQHYAMRERLPLDLRYVPNHPMLEATRAARDFGGELVKVTPTEAVPGRIY